MNFGHLRTFVAIVDAGGVHRAAARLNLSQPAVSRQIHALESDLGVPLFDRIGRRVQLTSEGEDLLRRTRRLLAEAESLSERAGALKTGETGILRIGGTPQVIESMLADFLNRFRKIYPGVEVQLIEEGGNNLPGLLERGHILLALMAVDDERFDYRLLFPAYGLAAVSRSTSSPVAVPSMSPSWQTSRWCCCAAVLRPATGSKPHAALHISGRACCWRPRPRTPRLPWRHPAME